MNKSKGFTIIELIVVIAIIAVLAAIVLVNVTSYINKGKNAAIVGNMASLITNSAVWYDNTGAGTYSGFCASANATAIQLAVTATNEGGTSYACFCDVASCGAASSKWCAVVTEVGGAGTYCVDSSGYKGALASGRCADISKASCQP